MPPKYEVLDQDESADQMRTGPNEKPAKLSPAGPAVSGSEDTAHFLLSLKGLFGIMWPTSASFMLQQATQQATIMFVGHIGPLELGAAAMGTMWINITGMSFVFGGLTAFDTLGSQAFGAGNFMHVGVLAQRALMICTLMCIPISLSWIFLTKPVLMLVGIGRVNYYYLPFCGEETGDLSQTWTRAYCPPAGAAKHPSRFT